MERYFTMFVVMKQLLSLGMSLSFAFGILGAMFNGIPVGLLNTFWSTIVVTISYWGVV